MGRIWTSYMLALLLCVLTHLSRMPVGESAWWHSLMNRFARL